MGSAVYIEPCGDYEETTLRTVVARWNSLFDQIVLPGDHVILKPNWIAESHKYSPEVWESVITHPALVTVVLQEVLRRLTGSGKVTITDGPQTDSSWTGIMNRMYPERWLAMGRASGVEVSLLDLRDDEWVMGAGGRDGAVVERRRLQGDPAGSSVCDLGSASEFFGHKKSRWGYYGADYDTAETNAAHEGATQKYKVSRTVIDADVFINLPKLKTHKKAGITCSLKNLVGINTYKNWLPHYSIGSPRQGGDQFAASTVKQDMESVLLRYVKRSLARFPSLGRVFGEAKKIGRPVFGDTKEVVRSGNWHGNDTTWRMVLDLNKVLFYANADGSVRPPTSPGARKRYLAIVDGVVAGEGDGPEAPTARQAQALFCGTDPVSLDALCATFMGFDWRRIATIRQGFAVRELVLTEARPEDVVVRSSRMEWNGALGELKPFGVPFRPHFGWVGYIEREPPART